MKVTNVKAAIANRVLTLITLTLFTAIVARASGKDAPLEILPVTVFKNLQAGKPQTVVVYGTSLTMKGEWPNALKRYYAREHALPLVDNYPNWLKLQREDETKFKKWLPDGLHPISQASLAVTWLAVDALLENARSAAGEH